MVLKTPYTLVLVLLPRARSLATRSCMLNSKIATTWSFIAQWLFTGGVLNNGCCPRRYFMSTQAVHAVAQRSNSRSNIRRSSCGTLSQSIRRSAMCPSVDPSPSTQLRCVHFAAAAPCCARVRMNGTSEMHLSTHKSVDTLPALSSNQHRHRDGFGSRHTRACAMSTRTDRRRQRVDEVRESHEEERSRVGEVESAMHERESSRRRSVEPSKGEIRCGRRECYIIARALRDAVAVAADQSSRRQTAPTVVATSMRLLNFALVFSVVVGACTRCSVRLDRLVASRDWRLAD